MNKTFVKTKNVKSFISLMSNIKSCPENIPRMALVYGEPGLGKTQTILWWVTNNDAIYVRCNHLMSGRWLLSEIAEELDEIPYYNSADLFKQIETKLKQEPKVIVVDEIDYLLSNANAIETLRDLHDRTNVPVVLVGMAKANLKLMRYKPLYDRLYDKLKFEYFTKNDIKEIIEALCEVKFTDCAIDYIFSLTNQFRPLVKIINKVEKIAKTNELKEFNAEILKGVLADEAKNTKTR